MTASAAARLERVGRVISRVVRQALDDNGAEAVVLLDAESAEGALLDRIFSVTGVPVAEYADPGVTMTAHPANKTALLVGGFIPRVDLFPLGDLYASQIAELAAGEWTGDDGILRLAAAAGGISQLDGLLIDLIDNRALPAELDVSDELCAAVLGAIQGTRFRRGRAGLVPKLGSRTIGVDLLD